LDRNTRIIVQIKSISYRNTRIMVQINLIWTAFRDLRSIADGGGTLEGWLNLETAKVSGHVTWIKGSTNVPTTYAVGFTNTDAAVTGTNYNPAAFPFFPTVPVVLEIGPNDVQTTPLSWNVQLFGTTFKRISGSAGGSTNFVTATINKADGQLKISYQPSDTGSTVKSEATGALDQPSMIGKGAAPGHTQVSTVSLHP
jgi:hypothetical protein